MSLPLNKLVKSRNSEFLKRVGRLRIKLDSIIAGFARPIRTRRENKRYAEQPLDTEIRFFVISCGRNSAENVLKCLQSVYDQSVKGNRVIHWLVDDASDDSTDKLIEGWLAAHPDHSVRYIRNLERKGGTANTYEALQQAPKDSIVLELNADDWLPDGELFEFLSKVYSNTQIWMTYNSYQYANGTPSERRRPYPKRVVRNSTYRQYQWICQHLHSFRSALIRHLPREIFLDPSTGQFLSSADDRSIYWSLLELCAERATHLERTTYVYNFHPQSEQNQHPMRSAENARKARMMPRLSRLDSL